VTTPRLGPRLCRAARRGVFARPHSSRRATSLAASRAAAIVRRQFFVATPRKLLMIRQGRVAGGTHRTRGRFPRPRADAPPVPSRAERRHRIGRLPLPRTARSRARTRRHGPRARGVLGPTPKPRVRLRRVGWSGPRRRATRTSEPLRAQSEWRSSARCEAQSTSRTRSARHSVLVGFLKTDQYPPFWHPVPESGPRAAFSGPP
jgi:hypothetical protein